MTQANWSDDRVEQLKTLWTEGLSASQIARALGGVTRNAVIGKVHRLGLSGRAAPSQPTRPLYKPARPPRPATSHGSGHGSHGSGSSLPPIRRSESAMSRPVISQPIVPSFHSPGRSRRIGPACCCSARSTSAETNAQVTAATGARKPRSLSMASTT